MAEFTRLTTVSSAEIVRHFGRWQDNAAKQPVVVTHHGRGRVVLVSADHYDELTAAADGEGRADGPTPDDVLAQVIDHVDQGFIAFRRDMTVAAINSAACHFMKVQRDSLLGRRFEDWLPGIEETPGYAKLAHAAASGSTATFEMPSPAYDGRWLTVQTFPLDDGAGCLFRDITDEIEAARQADARTATVAALGAHGGIGRAMLSPRGTFTKITAEFAALAGFTVEGLARARLTDVLVPRWRAGTADAIEAVLEGDGARAIEVQLLTKAGEERDVRIGLAPLRGQGGVTGAAVVMTDARIGALAAAR